MYRDIDRKTYEEEITPWLPEHIIDCHVHMWLKEFSSPISPDRYAEMWALEVSDNQTWDDLRHTCMTLMPRQNISVLAFGGVYRECDVVANNAYVLAGTKDPRNSARGLVVTKPEWSPEVIENAIADGFLGIKPYPDLSPKGMNDSSIYDFLPKSHLEVLNRLRGVLMLHLPRRGRLADPDNVREILEIADSYPSIKFVVAHIGRAYCLPNAMEGLPHFVNHPSVYFDTAANLNADVFRFALETVGPDRILYGSDLPIMLMRGVRDHVGDKYINYTDGEYSWNTNRRGPEDEAGYTFYLYEELKAIIKAVRDTGLGMDGMRKIMYSNAAALLGA